MNPQGWNVGDVVEMTTKDHLDKHLESGAVVEYIAPMTDDEKKKKWLEELVDAGEITLKKEEKKVEPFKQDESKLEVKKTK